MASGSSKLTVRHAIEGGWATDFGPVAEVGLTPGGVALIPYMLDAQNILLSLDGGQRKIGGTSKLNASAVGGGLPVRGLYDFWRQNSLGALQKRVVHAGTICAVDNADGSFSNIFTGLTQDAVPSYNTFDDKLIISSTKDAPRSYDGTTGQLLAGSPPNFAWTVTHKGRVFGGGDPANPSTLSYCVEFDPEDWVGSGSGSIQINPGDGDELTGAVSHKNELFLFKGPYRGSIHRLVGSSPTGDDAFALRPYIDGLGAIWHNSIFRFRDDIGFIWMDGSVHSLNATASYGDFYESSLSRPLNAYLRAHTRPYKLKNAWAAPDISASRVYLSVTIDAALNNNLTVVMDFRFDPPRWTYINAWGATALASVHDTSSRDLPVIMIGTSDGYVKKTDVATQSIDGVTAIDANVVLPYLNYGLPHKLKTIQSAGIGLTPGGNYTATFGWRRDNQTRQEQDVTQGGGDVLGPSATHPFTLDTSALSGGYYTDRWLDLPTGGEFRAVQYDFSQDGVNENLELHGFTVTMEVGSDSLENT